MASRRVGPATQSGLEAARHLCQEARAVLTSLRGGPPAVARGYLAQDLMNLRSVVKLHLETNQSPEPVIDTMPATIPEDRPVTPDSPTQPLSEEDDGAVIVQRSHVQMTVPEPASPMRVSKICNFSVDRLPLVMPRNNMRQSQSPETVGMFARPFLAVVMDPRAAGPHTLVALRALFRLLERGSLVKPSSTTHGYHVSLEPLMKGVLACKFEQTDAGADEAVEMAIADLLALLVIIDQRAFLPATLMEAFNTVFVTRNTFVHSPALCYHFEDVLASMVVPSFEDISSNDHSAFLILEFLVNQLLHTPLVGGDNLDEAGREAKVAHDATRVLCLRLIRCCLRTGWGHRKDIPDEEPRPASLHHPWEDRSLLSIIQDDLCLSLLMTGQAIWTYHDSFSNISPGFISQDVLSEICATLSTLWNTASLRRYLIPQFEQIFTGFYQRALVLLRKRNSPIDSASFNENLHFDSEVEIILESLVDLLGLHEPGHASSSGDAGALEALFSTYDCHMSRTDVASELVVELCRCCGGVINDEGDVMLGVFSSPSLMPDDARPETPATSETDISKHGVYIKHWRQVPSYLKELCADALVGSMKCLFDEEKAGKNVPLAQFFGSDTPEVAKGATDVDTPREESSLRTIQSKKRLMRRAARLFNEKPKKGIEVLVTSGLVPEPLTPKSFAVFLRNALVVGLDKVAVGMYLGEIGKAAEAGELPPIWERDCFHKEVLSEYCSLFHFEGQSLLDGLRMFLAAFRLPGESQQISRIIQAFADSCGQLCDESVRLKLFSDDPKRASDTAFLLAFSIIMLNTDLHNKNIREDRKMSLKAFIRNNTDYGRDITEEGKELPAEFLTSIYESIKDEQIRTEKEGADGHMTVERWKDVFRGSTCDEPTMVSSTASMVYDKGEVKELVVENLWMPIVSVVGSFWGVIGIDEAALEFTSPPRGGDSQNSMLGAQGARLGMDMALDVLAGVLTMGRLDLFQQIFKCVCYYTGLLGEYTSDAVDRTWTFVNSVEAQSAVVTAVRTARSAGDSIGVEGWTQLWGIMFELRDLKLLSGSTANTGRSIISETDPDLLVEEARREWTMYLAKRGMGGGRDQSRDKSKGVTSVLGVMGRALFGTEETLERGASHAGDLTAVEQIVHTVHGKENLVIWDELAPSDDEDDEILDGNSVDASPTRPRSAGAQFESQLIHEALIHDRTDLPVTVTGLERMEDTERFQISPRARVRKRLLRACDFSGLVSESRFMDLKGVQDMLSALVDIVNNAEKSGVPTSTEEDVNVEGVLNDGAFSANDEFPVSSASEAFAEVLICEIALKNRDRLGVIWQKILKGHYQMRLGERNLSSISSSESGILSMHSFPSPGIEKCVTGLLRICICAVMRENVANDVLGSLKLLCVPPTIVNGHLGKHNAEGLWRICRNVDCLSQLNSNGWEALLVLAEWCAAVSGLTGPRAVDGGKSRNGLAQEDPALQSYRSLHVLLHAPELSAVVPFTAVRSIRAVIIAGERVRFPKLSIAGLDLLLVLHTKVQSGTQPSTQGSDVDTGPVTSDQVWSTCWISVLDAIAEAGRLSMYPDVREHAISILTDAFIDKNGLAIPPEYVCPALQKVCIPLAGARLTGLLKDDRVIAEHMDEIMVEIELCICLVYKPLLHHLKRILDAQADLLSVWSSLLAVMELLLCNETAHQSAEDDGELVDSRGMTPGQLRRATKELATEHLRNAVMVLIASGVLRGEPESERDISATTWTSVSKMDFCKDQAEEWKQSAV